MNSCKTLGKANPSYDRLHLWFASPVLTTLLLHGADAQIFVSLNV